MLVLSRQGIEAIDELVEPVPHSAKMRLKSLPVVIDNGREIERIANWLGSARVSPSQSVPLRLGQETLLPTVYWPTPKLWPSCWRGQQEKGGLSTAAGYEVDQQSQTEGHYACLSNDKRSLNEPS